MTCSVLFFHVLKMEIVDFIFTEFQKLCRKLINLAASFLLFGFARDDEILYEKSKARHMNLQCYSPALIYIAA